MDASTTTSTANSGDKMNYALQVALQTVKERCIQLQRRVSSIEDENQRLRESQANNAAALSGDFAEVQTLRLQVADLQRQKEQLSEQINMVSDENRCLWSRLSQMAKEQPQQTATSPGKLDATGAHNVTAVGANQNLIRSKTFTQHSPNPHLRHKMISDGLRDISLETIALDDFVGVGAFAAGNETELAYPCGLQVAETPNNTEPDANVDAKGCMEGLQDLRREAMKQQQELSSVLTLLEMRIAVQPCQACAQKSAQKPEMADKSLETDESLNNELKLYHENSSSQQVPDTINEHNGYTSTPPSSRLNIIQEKIKADTMDKTCPMCGKMYSSQISFKAFQEHVEMHFIDDSPDLEPSIERNFEFISHAVGDF